MIGCAVKKINRPVFGVFLALLAYLCFSCMSGMAKLLSIRFHLNPEESYFYINFLAMVAVFFTIIRQKPIRFKPMHISGMLSRAIVGNIALNLTFIVVNYIALPLYFTITFLAPLLASAMAIIFLKEKFSIVKMALVILGFGGVLIAFAPFGNTARVDYYFIPILVTFIIPICAATIWILTKKFLNSESIYLVLFYVFGIGTLFSFIFMLVQYHTIIIPSLIELLMLIITVLFTIGGFYFFTKAAQVTQIQLILPAEYSPIVFGSLFSIIVFGVYPSFNILLGAAIIILANIILIIYNNTSNKISY